LPVLGSTSAADPVVLALRVATLVSAKALLQACLLAIDSRLGIACASMVEVIEAVLSKLT
jgi:hypothetical protein